MKICISKYFRWKYLLLPIIIYVSDDTVLFGTNINQTFIYAKYAILVSVLLMLSFGNKGFVHTRQFRFCIGMSLLVMFSSLLNDDLRLGLVYKCVVMLLSCAYVSKVRFEKFSQYFVGFIYLIALISVICTFAIMLKSSVFSFAPSIENTANTPFVNLFLYVAPTITEVVRNYGIFREPGVYQMYLIMALVLMLFYSSKLKLKMFIVITMALALTFSTTGYIAYTCVIALLVIKRNNGIISSKQQKMILTILALCIVVLATQTNLLSNDGIIFDKFSNNDRHTTIARMSSLTTNIKIWWQYPIFGAGLQKVNDLFELITFRDYGFASPHNTNTFLCELATFGIFYFSLFVIGVLRYCRLFGNSFLEHLLVFVILFVLSVGEKLTFSPFFYIMIFYGYKYRHPQKTL